MSDTPFIPGARVAVDDRFGSGIKESFVDKVYKNGNFTLRDSKQQWRPWHGGYGEKRWHATATGSGWHRASLSLWDEATDRELTEKIEAQKIKLRWQKIRSKIDGMKYPTAAMCDAIETALASSLSSPHREASK